jgi:hydrogenase nickel incorporation protein HypB
VPVVQINTGHACHLDARMVHRNLDAFDLHALDVLLIENVGNLVCPAEFDLGEHDKVMILSVTEGDDKPAKYPVMFHVARAMIVSKIDLLPQTDFNVERATRDARSLNLDLEVLPLSAKTGEGVEAWTSWLADRVARVKAR